VGNRGFGEVRWLPATANGAEKTTHNAKPANRRAARMNSLRRGIVAGLGGCGPALSLQQTP